uniref:hypothetical protein n=1 Tax=Arenibacter amylolyticus TaxID=1406873 RepID=UPI001C3E3060
SRINIVGMLQHPKLSKIQYKTLIICTLCWVLQKSDEDRKKGPNQLSGPFVVYLIATQLFFLTFNPFGKGKTDWLFSPIESWRTIKDLQPVIV